MIMRSVDLGLGELLSVSFCLSAKGKGKLVNNQNQTSAAGDAKQECELYRTNFTCSFGNSN